MPHVTPAKARYRHRHWRRDLIEVAAMFTAMAAADLAADLVNHGPDGRVLLVTSAAALLVAAGLHTWWARRHSHAPPVSAVPRAADRTAAGDTARSGAARGEHGQDGRGT
ncbi:MAG TPA: GNAT family N-acetyltransferase, partial [Streptomyces sp.]